MPIGLGMLSGTHKTKMDIKKYASAVARPVTYLIAEWVPLFTKPWVSNSSRPTA